MTEAEAMALAALDVEIEAYLDGLLDPAQARALERRFAEPDVSMVLAQAIALRELIASTPPDALPAGLEDRIVLAMGVEDPVPVGQHRRSVGERLGSLAPTPGPALTSARLAVRGTAPRAGRAAVAGLGSMRYALTPFRLLAGSDEEEPEPKPSWWRRALLRRISRREAREG